MVGQEWRLVPLKKKDKIHPHTVQELNHSDSRHMGCDGSSTGHAAVICLWVYSKVAVHLQSSPVYT